jgi:DNA-binding LytR/AlgR family response regulator
MDKKINCLIVDDELFARNLLRSFTEKIPYLNVIAICENAFEAAYILQGNQPIDLLITDIQMPQISGLEFIKSLPSLPQIIITTAHPDYALEGFELGVADFLKKPIFFERFFKAINRINAGLGTNKTSGEPAAPVMNKHLFVKEGHTIIRINIDDILYIEGLKNFISIVTKDKKITAYMRMKNIEEMLPQDSFFRIHKSYIVNLSAIKTITGNSVELTNGILITISKQYKLELIRFLGIKNTDDAE